MHINPGCVTEEMIDDFVEFDLTQNENWIDLAIELRSSELIYSIGALAIERIIKDGDPDLFKTIYFNEMLVEEVFRRNKYSIAMSLDDERVIGTLNQQSLWLS